MPPNDSAAVAPVSGVAAGAADGVGAAPAVSVIMPTYNVARYIGEALESVFAQTFKDFEVIVVNDGSPDTPELERVLAPYLSRIVYLKQENGGVSAARNAAIRAARAPLVAHLDPDDLWEPDYLAAQLEELGRDPSTDVLYPDALIFGDAPEAGRRFMEWCPSAGEVSVEALLEERCHVMCAVTARRDALLRAGLFDEGLRCSEDFELWLRVLKSGGRIRYQRRVLARYRRHDASHTADPARLSRAVLRMLDKVETSLDLAPAELRALRGMRGRVRAGAALEDGKAALSRGDVGAALARLRAANAHQRSLKLSLVVLALRFAPGLARAAYAALRPRATLQDGGAGPRPTRAGEAKTDGHGTL
ncbi:MAG: glycosyltransferase family 2 protein [Acidobacteria bacterium]|nr:glycosyltransferase family 2 protein [Acidobacteriota bacterium]